MKEKDEELRQLRHQIEQIDAENLKYRQMNFSNEELISENQRLLEENAQILQQNQLLNRYLQSIKEQNLNNCATFMANTQNSEMIYDERMEAVARKVVEGNVDQNRNEKIEITMFNGEGQSEQLCFSGITLGQEDGADGRGKENDTNSQNQTQTLSPSGGLEMTFDNRAIANVVKEAQGAAQTDQPMSAPNLTQPSQPAAGESTGTDCANQNKEQSLKQNLLETDGADHVESASPRWCASQEYYNPVPQRSFNKFKQPAIRSAHANLEDDIVGANIATSRSNTSNRPANTLLKKRFVET